MEKATDDDRTRGLTVRRLDATLVEAFYWLHDDRAVCAGCYCAAWWVPTWEEWADRTEEENRSLRADLFSRGEYDGYLLFEGTSPIGWCQVGPRDRLPKLREQHLLPPDPAAWAVTCFLIRPDRRHRGRAGFFLERILGDLRARGVRRVEAFPRTEDGLPDDDVWTGPLRLFVSADFRTVAPGERRAVLALDL